MMITPFTENVKSIQNGNSIQNSKSIQNGKPIKNDSSIPDFTKRNYLCLFILLTVCISVLSGCAFQGAVSDGDISGMQLSGGFTEEVINIDNPDIDLKRLMDVTQFWEADDGSLQLVYSVPVDYNSEEDYYVYQYHWISSDSHGKNWKEHSLPSWDGIDEYSLRKDGTIYGFDYRKRDTLRIYREGKGQTSAVDTTIDQVVHVQITDTENGAVALAVSVPDAVEKPDAEKLTGINPWTGEMLWSIRLNAASFYGMTADALIVLAESGDMISYDLVDGHEILRQRIPNEIAEALIMTWQDYRQMGDPMFGDTDYLYMKSGSEVHINRVSLEDWNAEQLLNSTRFDYGQYDNHQLRYISAGSDESIYLVIKVAEDENPSEGTAIRIHHFQYDTRQINPDKKLTVWSMGHYTSMDAAKRSFQKSHPEVEVVFQSPDYQGLLGQSKTLNDELTALNTALLAGKGPDVLLLDGLDYQTFMEKGVLADLTDIYGEYTFVGSTVSSLLYDGKCYVIPDRFSATVWFGDDLPEITTPKQLRQLLQQDTGGDDLLIYMDIDREGAAAVPDGFESRNLLRNTCLTAILTENGIDETAAREWLEAVKVSSDYGLSRNRPSLYGSDYRQMGEGYILSSDIRYPYGMTNGGYITVNLKDWMQGLTKYGATELMNVETVAGCLYHRVKTTGQKAEHFSLCQYPGLSGQTYRPLMLMSVNAKSGQIDLAKEFIRTCLSDAEQRKVVKHSFDGYQYNRQEQFDTIIVSEETSQYGIPIVKSALDDQLDYYAPLLTDCGWDAETYRGFFDTLSVPVAPDAEILYEFNRASADYCANGKSVEQVIETLKENLRLRMAEQ